MNQLIYSFLNEIEDVNKIKEMSVEEFTKLVNSNNLISEEDAKQLIESFKKISTKKISEEDTSDADQRKKKYRQQHKHVETKDNEMKQNKDENKEKEDDSRER